ncbi:hypothetical protein PR202_gb04924 [Eleusine coracana subsp. coracana]|uniref:Uncharacterized protein n=1 Tax=Eleusine coracana subsp. coracana TaxID=191504 RepID=A0AAV5E5B1_ELECO|nr:hypothetical protein PR202_gb04924 [Eleusine coracana subsp. coracana]
MAQPLPTDPSGKELLSATQERISITQQQACREHTKNSASSLSESSLPTDLKLRTKSFHRLSIDDVDAHMTPLLNARQGCNTPQDCLGSAPKSCAKEKAGEQQKHPVMERAGMNLGGGMSPNHHGTRKAGMVPRDDVLQNPKNHHAATRVGMGSSGGMPQQHRTAMKGDMSLSGRLQQKNNEKDKTAPSQLQHDPQDTQVACMITEPEAPRVKKHIKVNTCFKGPHSSRPIRTKNAAPSFVTPHGTNTAQDNTKSVSSEISCVVDVNKNDEEEAERAIQLLNEQGSGENMSYQEYLSYLNKLPCDSPRVDRKTKLHGMGLNDLAMRLALHRFKYLKVLSKWLKKAPKNEPCDDTLKDDCLIEETLDCIEEDASKLKEGCSLKWLEENIECLKEDGCKLLHFLEEQEYFKRFEKDGTFDWFFHPDHCSLACLDDYQRLVPRNFGGEYVNWDEYRKYFHSYEIEKEYVQYCEELSEKLKWMEGYVLMKPTSRTDFVDDMTFDACWFKELDGVYFEVWQRITKLKMSFRDALDEVCNLNKYPLRQPRMKRALDTDCSKMEKEFHTCIKGITGEVTDERAQELIAEAVKQLKEKPKFYVHYIKKKIIIARVIGLIRD